MSDTTGQRQDLGLVEKSAGSCGCGEAHEDLPELDVRVIPHAIRHGAVFGAMDQIGEGGSIVLVAHHDPVPLLRQLQARYSQFGAAYLTEGPDEWKLVLSR